jgi:ATP/maltotriose-dependent transcriptional regulator MalT
MAQARAQHMTPTRPSSAHLPAHVVRRSRLVDRINRPGARLIVVTGPAGSGKTVAVRDWASTVELPVAWLPLDGRHTDPEYFLEALLHTLESLSPGVHEATWRDDPDDHAADRAIDRAVEHLSAAPRATLVLDDLHVIDRSPTTDLLARLVDVIPATNLSLIVLSRSDPPFQLHRFRLAGELVELRESDLRFDRDEASRFFERFPQVELDDIHVERLAERTEGWAAGLQFAALSLAGREDTDATATWPTSCSTRSSTASPTRSGSSCWPPRCSISSAPSCASTSPAVRTPLRCCAASRRSTCSWSRSTTSASGSAITTSSASFCDASCG